MALSEYLLAWRTTQLPDREVVDALVDPAYRSPTPRLARELEQWPGSYYWSDEPDGRHLVLTRPLTRRRERWVLHVLLFLATLFTTTFVGAVFDGRMPLDPNPLALITGTYPLPPGVVHAWVSGFRFSLPLLAILLCHEFGHYLTARRYQLDVSPPYFIPVPFVPWSIGTMGAFIRLRTILSDRRQLLDVGIAGPIGGLLVALPVLWIGLRLSQPLPGPDVGLLVKMGTDAPYYPIGDSLLTLGLRHLIHGDAPAVLLDPMGFAGWLGIIVTMYNLLPISQLDGGHILYAALPGWHQRVALAFWALIVVLGALWKGWFLWGFLVLLLSRGRLGHPAVLDAQRPLPRTRRALAWVALVLFLITFAPVPFRI
ncbi:MAG TPA: site-2 protease family protein [Gemmatimonadales bacterium]|nr:site-2 protease family protein [Gemmatimonadales bacterium]